MTWDMKWYDADHTILLFTIQKNSTWEDFHLAMNNYVSELAATSKTIHAIIYDEFGLPPGNPMPHFRTQMQRTEQYRNTGLIVTVSPHSSTGFLQSVVDLTSRFMRIGPKKGVFVKSIDEAVERIHKEQARVNQSV